MGRHEGDRRGGADRAACGAGRAGAGGGGRPARPRPRADRRRVRRRDRRAERVGRRVAARPAAAGIGVVAATRGGPRGAPRSRARALGRWCSVGAAVRRRRLRATDVVARDERHGQGQPGGAAQLAAGLRRLAGGRLPLRARRHARHVRPDRERWRWRPHRSRVAWRRRAPGCCCSWPAPSRRRSRSSRSARRGSTRRRSRRPRPRSSSRRWSGAGLLARAAAGRGRGGGARWSAGECCGRTCWPTTRSTWRRTTGTRSSSRSATGSPGEGPALMTEYEPYGVRHFLRKADAEGASELRRRVVPLRSGRPLRKLGTADIDEFELAGIRSTARSSCAARRSPAAPLGLSAAVARPVLRRVAAGPGPAGLASGAHSAGRTGDPAARPACATGAGARPPRGRSGGPACRSHVPAGHARSTWPRPPPGEPGQTRPVRGMPGAVYPRPEARFDATVTVRRPGEHVIFVGGAFRRELEVAVDGRRVATQAAPPQPPGALRASGRGRPVTRSAPDGASLPPRGARRRAAVDRPSRSALYMWCRRRTRASTWCRPQRAGSCVASGWTGSSPSRRERRRQKCEGRVSTRPSLLCN